MFEGLGWRVSGFRDQGGGFRVKGLGWRVGVSGFRGEGAGCRVDHRWRGWRRICEEEKAE